MSNKIQYQIIRQPISPTSQPIILFSTIFFNNILIKPHQLQLPFCHYNFLTANLKMSMSKIRNRTALEDFCLLSLIGKGTYAKVALVRRKDSLTIHAMKIIKKKQSLKKKQQEQITNERNILSSTDHPFIIRMNGCFQTPERLFFVLEYCPGGDLYGLISKRHRFTEEQARFCASQIILALEYLHERNIVYRDLKPENVLLDKLGYFKLTDFGLSTICESTQETSFMPGTSQYLAPELISKLPHGKPVDYWCLGNLIYQMVVGYPAFYSGNDKDSFVKILSLDPSFPARTSSRLKSLLQGLFNKDPDHRLGSKNIQQIKQHPWFSKTNWESILNKQQKSPFVPLVEQEDDISNFDDEFTQCEVTSWDDKKSESSEQWDLSDFSFEKENGNEGENNESEESSGESSFYMKEQEEELILI